MGMLDSHVLIITGSSSGIGLATASAALSEGAKVVGTDILSPPASLLEHTNFRFVPGDLTHHSTIQEVVATCTAAFGRRLDGLLNVAGVADHFGSVDSVSDELWERCLAVNLTAPVKLMREAIPLMREQKSGSIVNVSSKAGLSGAAAGVAYTASKHGLIGATKNVAWRFKDENIRCNAVCPGGVPTGFGKESNTSCDLDALAALQPIYAAHMPDGEPTISPEEVAKLLLFLVSPLSGKITGAVIPIDNAWSTI